MKKTLFYLLALLLMTGSAFAQKPFEGTLTFDFKFLGEGADQIAAFAPTAMVYQVRGSDMTLEIQGGMMAAMMGKILINGKTEETYMIKDAEQTAYRIVQSEEDKAEEKTEIASKVTKEDEIITIMGYKCQKYKVVIDAQGEEVTSYVWATEELKITPPKKTDGMVKGSLNMKDVPGIPLKKMTTLNMGGMSITQVETLKKIDTEKLPKNAFDIPAGYKVEDMDPATMMGGMMGN